jgi:hypothetical protein
MRPPFYTYEYKSSESLSTLPKTTNKAVAELERKKILLDLQIW